LTNFNRLLSVSSNNVLAGKAQLGRGWCYWISNMIPESVAAFKAATTLLPPSEDLAVARFKLADGLLMQKDFGGALTNYQGALQDAADLPHVKDALTPQALYQMLRASLGLKDLAGAEDAMRKILRFYPQSAVADRSVLLVGQGYADAARPEEARARFTEFVQLFPDSDLRPEVELAIAQTREQASDWPAAIGAYDAWLDGFATNRLRPQAEFCRALANFHAGNETNALTQLTNFVAQFATNDLAPLAQWWVADYYYRKGGEFYRAAETGYRDLFQRWPASPLASEARMMAGRAALGRQDYPTAIGYFTNLTSSPNWSPLKIQATFAYGSVLVLQTNTSASLREAIQVFSTIIESSTNTDQAARAWGEIGKCYFQLAVQEERYYESASNAYLQVVSSPSAGVDARSQATIGLALVAEKRGEAKSGEEKTALLKLAREYYLDVFYETNLREGEKPDLFWVKEAGLGAARIAESESFQAWSQAEKFYDRLLRLLPQMKDTLEKKKARVQARLERKEN
jgi:outer membrane protein assembly factor BamD (BamD/ComL family)